MSTTQDARKKFTIASAQENLYSVNVANVVGKTDTDKMGTVYNPYTSTPVVSDGAVSGAAYAVGTYSADADSLQVNRRASASEHVDSYDWKSVDFGLLGDRGMNMGKGISQVIDGFFLNLPVTTSGVAVLGDAGVAGAAAAWTSSSTVIDDIINTSLQEIELENSYDQKFMVVSSYEANDLRQYLQTTGNMVMDEVIRAGIPSSVTSLGTTFSGVKVFQSNNITQSVVLGIATQPTAGDTISVAGVTATFVAALTGAASEIHITASVDATAANYTAWLNSNGATAVVEATNTGASAASNEDQARLSRLGVVATHSTGDDEITITTKGVVKLAETLAAGSDVFAAASRFLVFGDMGSINLYLPTAGMDYEEKSVSGKAGVELFMEQFYNAVIWTGMKLRVLAVKVN